MTEEQAKYAYQRYQQRYVKKTAGDVAEPKKFTSNSSSLVEDSETK